jgi:hypothetical protein
MERCGKMKITIMASLLAKRDMNINACQAGLGFNEYLYYLLINGEGQEMM